MYFPSFYIYNTWFEYMFIRLVRFERLQHLELNKPFKTPVDYL